MTNRIKSEAFSFNSANLMNAYTPLAGNPQPRTRAPGFMLHIINDATTSVGISIDGVNTFEYVRAASDIMIPLQTNAQPNAYESLLPANSSFWFNGAAGVGTIVIIVYYLM